MPDTVLGQESINARLDEASAIALALIGTASTLRLYKAGSNLGPNSPYADYVAAECDFSGYAAVPMTFTGPLLDRGDQAVLTGNEAAFACDDTVTFNSVGGAWLEVNEGGSPAVHKIVAQYPFNLPVGITRVGAFVSGNLYLKFPGLAGEFVYES